MILSIWEQHNFVPFHKWHFFKGNLMVLNAYYGYTFQKIFKYFSASRMCRGNYWNYIIACTLLWTFLATQYPASYPSLGSNSVHWMFASSWYMMIIFNMQFYFDKWLRFHQSQISENISGLIGSPWASLHFDNTSLQEVEPPAAPQLSWRLIIRSSPSRSRYWREYIFQILQENLQEIERQIKS